MGNVPEHFDTIFEKLTDDAREDTEDDESGTGVENPSDDSSDDPWRRIWLYLRYATITMRFEPPESVPGVPEVSLELIHTATSEVLKLESQVDAKK